MENQFVRRELQINIHPNDWQHFESLLRHEIKVWGKVVNRIRLTLDLHNSQSGRYHSQTFSQNLVKIKESISKLKNYYQEIVVDEVDVSDETRRLVARKFFNLDMIPIKAWDGGPFYSYLYGLWSSKADTLIHIDSDMMFGGLSPKWLDEAENILINDHTVAFVAPLSGPPHPEGIVFGHNLQRGIKVEKYNLPNSFQFNSVSTRVFVTKPKLLESRMGFIELIRPSLLMRIKAKLLGNPPDSREFEVLLSKMLQTKKLKRVDFLGSGLWSLHPPFRTQKFYVDLPLIIKRIEEGDLPNEQLGHYDICDQLFDWTEVRLLNSKWRRLLKQCKRVITRHL